MHQQFEIAEAMKLQSDLWHVETTTHTEGRRDTKERRNKQNIIIHLESLKEATLNKNKNEQKKQIIEFQGMRQDPCLSWQDGDGQGTVDPMGRLPKQEPFRSVELQAFLH